MSNTEQDYLPMMMKIYSDGKLTSSLKKSNFTDVKIKFSIPRGRGLELDATNPGRIIVVAGGTGLFPFSDLIDLVFKSEIIEKKHMMSQELLAADPLLR
jgi:NAD(P)H-flavin reductase